MIVTTLDAWWNPMTQPERSAETSAVKRGYTTVEVITELREIATSWCVYVSDMAGGDTVPIIVANVRQLTSRLDRAAMELSVLLATSGAAELAELREDRARLDWLERMVDDVDSCCPPWSVWRIQFSTKDGQTLREACDAARAAEVAP